MSRLIVAIAMAIDAGAAGGDAGYDGIESVGRDFEDIGGARLGSRRMMWSRSIREWGEDDKVGTVGYRNTLVFVVVNL